MYVKQSDTFIDSSQSDSTYPASLCSTADLNTQGKFCDIYISVTIKNYLNHNNICWTLCNKHKMKQLDH